MSRFWYFSFVLIAAVSTQLVSQIVWEPPDWNFPQETKATVPKVMLDTLRVSGVGIKLGKTGLEKAKQALGGQIGSKGDAGDAVHWLCFHGVDGGSKWVLWLESGEIDGRYVGSFRLQSASSNTSFDGRCQVVNGPAAVKIGLPLKLGMTGKELLRVLGKPSLRQSDNMIYLHEHQELLNGTTFDSSNIVVLQLHGGKVTSIAVSKTTSS